MGSTGGGDPLTTAQIATIKSTANISSTASSLADQLGTDDTNLVSSLEFGGYPATSRFDRASALLKSVGLEEDQQRRRPGRLSGGQQQLVSIARALANQPACILADEPTGNLDSVTGKKIFDLLHDLSRSQQTTIIVVAHDLDIARKTDKTFTLRDGKITTK